MRPQSAKAKGRRLQQIVRDSILSRFPVLTQDDVRSTSMGAGGEDVQLSSQARTLFPYSIECKNQERLNLWSSLDQAKVNAPPSCTSLLVLKRIPELKFASEWFLQTFESSGFPKLARSFIKSYKERLLTSSLPTISDLIPFDLSTAHSSTLAAMHTGP